MTGQVTQAVDEARGFCKDEAMVGSSIQFCLEHWWEGVEFWQQLPQGCNLVGTYVYVAVAGESGMDMEVQMKHKCVTEFLHVKKMLPTDIH